MQKRPIQAGRPAGATTFDAELAQAFGAAVRALRSCLLYTSDAADE